MKKKGRVEYSIAKYAVVILVLILAAGSCKNGEESIAPERKPNVDSFSLKPPYHFPGDLEILPADSGGVHLAVPLSEEEVYGHYIYLPSGYIDTGPAHPLLVFLHGSGEKGNSQDSAQLLNRVLVNGPPKLIEAGDWPSPYPLIVVSPQCHDASWEAEKIHDFIEGIARDYTIDQERIYLTGISMGGNGTFNYISAYGDSSFAAAVVPIAGWGDPQTGEAFLNTPVWAFHNADDSVIRAQSSINMVEGINEQGPAEPAKLTIFPFGGHNSWSKPYSGTGMGTESPAYDSYNETIYNWLFTYEKNN